MSENADIENAMVQRTRKQHLVNYCHKRKRSDIYPMGRNATVGLSPDSFKNVIVSDKHQILYCMIPKVACSNWRRVLLVIEGYVSNPHQLSSAEVHNKSFGLFRRLSDYTPEEITFRLATYYKFLFVRNPFERLTSTFRNKFVDSYDLKLFKEIYGKYILKKYRPNATLGDKRAGDGVNFHEFVQYIVDSPSEDPSYFDRHWERYDRLCLPCLIYYDFIGKFETLLDDADYLLRVLDLNDKVSFPDKLASNYSIPTKALTNLFFQNLSPELRDKLYQVYKHDFDLFGYKKPVYKNNNK